MINKIIHQVGFISLIQSMYMSTYSVPHYRRGAHPVTHRARGVHRSITRLTYVHLYRLSARLLGLWEETGAPWENRHRHKEAMLWTLHKRAPASTFKTPWTTYCYTHGRGHHLLSGQEDYQVLPSTVTATSLDLVLFTWCFVWQVPHQSLETYNLIVGIRRVESYHLISNYYNSY